MDFSTAGRLPVFLNTTGDTRCGRFQAHSRHAFVQAARLLLAHRVIPYSAFAVVHNIAANGRFLL
jgi:hypothetical protein